MIEGLQLAYQSDEALLEQGMTLFDSLYRSFEQSSRATGPRVAARPRRPAASESKAALTDAAGRHRGVGSAGRATVPRGSVVAVALDLLDYSVARGGVVLARLAGQRLDRRAIAASAVVPVARLAVGARRRRASRSHRPVRTYQCVRSLVLLSFSTLVLGRHVVDRISPRFLDRLSLVSASPLTLTLPLSLLSPSLLSLLYSFPLLLLLSFLIFLPLLPLPQKRRGRKGR